MNIEKIIIFVVGFGAGAVAATLYLKDRFAEKAINADLGNEDSEEQFEKEQDESEEAKEEPVASEVEIRKKPGIIEYAQKLKEEGYNDYSSISNNKEPKKKYRPSEMPYIIKPNAVGDEEFYEQIALSYYTNGVVTDDMDEPIVDAEDIIGSLEEIAEYFDEYPEDEYVYIQNDKLKTYFEVFKEETDYIPE